METSGSSLTITYGLDGADKGDKINQMDIINSEQNEGQIYTTTKDLIPFYINILNTEETVVFRASITELSEDITPNWEEISYIGRPDKQYVYKNTDRKNN